MSASSLFANLVASSLPPVATRLCCILQPDVTHVDTLRKTKKKLPKKRRKNTKSFTRKMLHVPHGASQGKCRRWWVGRKRRAAGAGRRGANSTICHVVFGQSCVYRFCFFFFFRSGSKSQGRRKRGSSCRCAAHPSCHTRHTHRHSHTHTHTATHDSTIRQLQAGKFRFYLWQISFVCLSRQKNQILKLCSLNNKTKRDNNNSNKKATAT